MINQQQQNKKKNQIPIKTGSKEIETDVINIIIMEIWRKWQIYLQNIKSVKFLVIKINKEQDNIDFKIPSAHPYHPRKKKIINYCYTYKFKLTKYIGQKQYENNIVSTKEKFAYWTQFMLLLYQH